MILNRFSLAVSAGLALSALSACAQSATATISAVQSGLSYDYTITLMNTGSDNLESFWYGWTTSGNNLPSDPSNAGNLSAWANDLDANSIQWVGNASTALMPGQSATFTFVSTSSPSTITQSPSGESVAYTGGIHFSENVPGTDTPVFSPTLVSVPEPSALGLVVIGSLGFWGALRRKFRGQPTQNH
jgi:hypothetical protein